MTYESFVWQDDTLGHAGRSRSVHDDGGVKLFRFRGYAVVFRADGDDLVEAVKLHVVLVA